MEQARLKEFFKYFRATSQAVSLTHEDIDSPDNYRSNEAILSADIVLNALVQLVVQRLQADRAFISLIDDEFQFIIAEATKSISLVDASTHDPDDQICIGAKPLSLDAGICAGTMHAFTNNRSPLDPVIQTANIYADSTRYVINDLTKEDLYRSRPYVTGYPHMRWYAEVPLRTPTGYAIGSLAVVDKSPRTGLKDDEHRVMLELASAAMKHLDMLRIAAEHSRAVSLLDGLDKFVHQRPPLPSNSRRNHPPSALSNDTEEINKGLSNPLSGTKSHAMGSSVGQSVQSSHETRTSTTSTTSETQETSINDSNPPSSDTQSKQASQFDYLASPRTRKDPKAHRSRSPVGAIQTHEEKRISIFSSAAVLLREAADLDGVVFLDASPAEINHSKPSSSIVTSPNAESLTVSDGGLVARSPASQNDPFPDQKSPLSTQKYGKQLGSSFRSRVRSYVSGGPERKLSVPISVVRALLHYFPKGAILDFDHVRHASATSFKPDDLSLALCPRSTLDSPSSQFPDPLQKLEVETELRTCLPASRSIIFQPLWNSQTENWYAVCLAWSNDPKSILQGNDLSYITAFSNSIMAEVINLELKAIDNAKSDFISSISHEVRSPLHGILGSAEMLSDVMVNKEQRSLVQIIENCGRNLLETIDNILHYSKINTKARITRELETERSQHGEESHVEETLPDISNFDVSILVEKCVESLIVGHQNSISQSTATHFQGHTDGNPEDSKLILNVGNKVVVILRVSRRDSWTVSSRPAIWQRILINLLGNAMKYTAAGYIEIDLSAFANDDSQSSLVTLSVRDTGRGISQSYLQNRLYQPFVQEDTLSPGTGLGLSIVKGLVDELRGDITIRSAKGVGTEATVRIPVNLAETSSSAPFLFQDQPLCLLGFDAYPELENIPTGEIPTNVRRALALKNNLTLTCEEWLKMKVTHTNHLSAARSNIIAIMENNAHVFKHSPDAPGLESFEVPDNSAVILLCADHTTKEKLRYHQPIPGVFYLSQPFGPMQVIDVMTSVEAYLKCADSPQHNLTKTDSPRKKFKSTVAPTAPDGPGEKYVLLVEDNSVNLQLLIRSMQKIGRKFLTAVDGLQALEIYRSRCAEIEHIFMDVSMPVMDGFTATREIRAFETKNGHPRTPITMVTGLGSDAAQKEAELCGCDRFMVKPVRLASLRSLLDKT